MLTKITRLEKLDGFRLRLRFSDGSEGVHDFASMVEETGPMMEPLRGTADHVASLIDQSDTAADLLTRLES